MQSLFSFFGKSTESQGLGFQNSQNLPAIKSIEINSQEKAAAFLKILSDCSPEAGSSYAFSSETAGKAETIGPDMTANMSGPISFNNFDKLQENFNVTLEGLSPEGVDPGGMANNEEKHFLVSLLLNPAHSLNSQVKPNENADVKSEKTDESVIDPALNPVFFFATTDDYSEPALPANLTEKILSNDLMEDDVQKDGETITAPQNSSGNSSRKNSINVNKNQVPTPTVPIATNKETSQPSIVSNEIDKKNFQPAAVSNLTKDMETQEDDIPIQQQKEIVSVKKGIEKPQLFQSDQGVDVKPNSNADAGSTREAIRQKSDTSQQQTGIGRSFNPASTAGQNPDRQYNIVQSAITDTKAINENQVGSEIPIEIEKIAGGPAENQSSLLSEKGLKKSQDGTADVSNREFAFMKSGHYNSHEKSSGEYKDANSNNSDSKNENHTMGLKDRTIEKNSVFQKFYANDALKPDGALHSDVAKKNETQFSQSDTNISKQPVSNPGPSLPQNQIENRMPINADPLQQTDLNTGLDVDKAPAKVGDGKTTGFQTDQIRSGNSPEERTDVIRQIVQHMNYRQIGTRSQMVVNLKPESLGRLRMQIETENQHVTVKMISSSNSVKELIEQQLHTLKQELKGHGLEVQKIDVTVQSDSDQQRNGHPSGTFHQNAQQKEYQNKRQQMGQSGNRSIKNKDSVIDVDRVDTQRHNTDNSEVDYFA